MQIEVGGRRGDGCVWVRTPACGGAFGQIGYAEIEPYMDVDDEYFAPTPFTPHGQHWLITTKMVYAWRLVGYDQPWAVNHDNPNRTIAFIDSGIDMNHSEFGGYGALPWKIHPASATFVEAGYPLIATVWLCTVHISSTGSGEWSDRRAGQAVGDCTRHHAAWHVCVWHRWCVRAERSRHCRCLLGMQPARLEDRNVSWRQWFGVHQ
ncbi:MAG: hypothetical protein Kow0022_09690 [Phycisphaerales bacterium]